MDRVGFVALAAAAMTFVALLMFASPFLAPYGTYAMLDGDVGFIDHSWGSNGVPDLIYLLGDLFCHQEESRCLSLNGSQMPFCIRDTGIIVGAAAGFWIALAIRSVLHDRRVAVAGAVMVLTTLAEWVLERFLGDMPLPRAATGFLAGAGFALILCWMLYREKGDGQAKQA